MRTFFLSFVTSMSSLPFPARLNSILQDSPSFRSSFFHLVARNSSLGKFAATALLVALIAPIIARGTEEPKGTSDTITLRLETPSTGSKCAFVETLKASTEFLAAVAWPGAFLTLIITQRKQISRLFDALLNVVQSSTRIKLGELIDLEVDRSVRQAEQRPTPSREVSNEELEAASRVGRIVSTTELPAIRARLLEAAHEYEATRANLPPGPARTRAMNAVVAKMRTLAIAGKPLLKEFTAASDSSGMRLAATAILQLSPDLNYVGWLAERMKTEQPFVFFHASLALLATARSYGSTAAKQLRPALERALEAVMSFEGGVPDANTVEVLKAGLRELQHAS